MPDPVGGQSAAEMSSSVAAIPSAHSAEHLVVSGVSKRFGGVNAVQDVSLSLRAGEIVSIIGPNGAGKTSLLNTISGFYRPDTGRITMDGVDITTVRPSKIAALGIARTFQNIALFTGLTVVENVMLGRHIHMTSGVLACIVYLGRARRQEEESRRHAVEVLELLGLSHLRGKMSGELAYGLRKACRAGPGIGAQTPRSATGRAHGRNESGREAGDEGVHLRCE
jgi:branched-chain amino acid transport system ATP-binding protein